MFLAFRIAPHHRTTGVIIDSDIVYDVIAKVVIVFAMDIEGAQEPVFVGLRYESLIDASHRFVSHLVYSSEEWSGRVVVLGAGGYPRCT